MTGTWYKEFYLTTEEGENNLKAALTHPIDAEQNISDVRRRFEELKGVPSDRCAISSAQVKFLDRVLSEIL